MEPRVSYDALSEYIFKCVENKEDIFKDLLSITSPETFEKFVAKRRNSSSIKMKNDDVALMILEVSNATSPESPSPPKETHKGNSKASENSTSPERLRKKKKPQQFIKNQLRFRTGRHYQTYT